MPRITATPIVAPAPYANAGVSLTFTVADVVNMHQVLLTGKEILLVRNTGASAATFTVTSAPDTFGRTRDIAADSVAAGAFRIYQQFPLHGWQQPDGFLYFQASSTDISFAVIRLP